MSDSSKNQKPFGVTNIKVYVPLILDLNQLNYYAWKELFQTHCSSFGVKGHLTGTSKPADDKDEAWTHLDDLVKMWIYGTVTQSLLNMILKPNATAHTVWSTLETLFRDNQQTRAIELDQELRTLTLGDLTISQYCERMKVISDLLANIGSPVPEHTLVTYLINGLSPKYDNIATVLRHQNPPPSLLKCRSILTLEERTLNRNRPVQPLHMDHASSPNALHVGNPPNSQIRASTNNRGGRRHSQSRRGGSNVSDNCRPPAVAQQNPPGLPWNPHSVPWTPFMWPYVTWQQPYRPPTQQQQPRQQPGVLGSAPHQTSGATSPHQQHAAFYAALHSPGLLPPTQWFPPLTPDQPTDITQALNAMQINDQSDPNWYMDTGATSHLTSDTGTKILFTDKKIDLYSSMSKTKSKKRFKKECVPGKTKGRSNALIDSISGSSFQLSGSSSAKKNVKIEFIMQERLYLCDMYPSMLGEVHHRGKEEWEKELWSEVRGVRVYPTVDGLARSTNSVSISGRRTRTRRTEKADQKLERRCGEVMETSDEDAKLWEDRAGDAKLESRCGEVKQWRFENRERRKKERGFSTGTS
ncbi:unnamed protein product [Lactuca virosa]|uniref:Hybrid signal transduction histidine kinase M n=1 Tax=Lactuca virosa TaxID=75947 RepID=A0AAU9MC59_9ASTR|nr:unnamed protein product [Lactuca virosa]